MRRQVPNQEQIIEALDLAEMGLTAEQAYKIGRVTGDMISSAFALGRVAAAEDVDQMPTMLGDQGWQRLADKAAEADCDPQLVWRRRRRDDFTTATIEGAYQYGYRQASRVARGVTRPKATEPEPDDEVVPCALTSHHRAHRWVQLPGHWRTCLGVRNTAPNP